MEAKKIQDLIEVPAIPYAIEKQLLSVEMVPVEKLVVDHDYQRPRDEARISRMSREWNWLACGTLAVNLRPDTDGNTYAVIDGQQRLATIVLMGYPEAPCRIYCDLTKEQEAELFELLNRSKKPGFNDLFRSRLLRDEPVAAAINVAVLSAGFQLDPERKRNSDQVPNGQKYIQTMQEMERIYRLGGSILIIETLKFIKTAWPDQYLYQQQMVIAGVATFLKNYKSQIKMTEMLTKATRAGLQNVIQRAFQYAAARGKAAGGNSRGAAFSEALLMLHNQNREQSNRIHSKA